MKYSIADENGNSVSLKARPGGDVWMEDGTGRLVFAFTLDEFKDFRRAVGYVWTELEAQ